MLFLTPNQQCQSTEGKHFVICGARFYRSDALLIAHSAASKLKGNRACNIEEVECLFTAHISEALASEAEVT